MLPKYMKISNFSSYIDENIDFTLWKNLSVLLGENGAGKTSIIDMITVSIFFRCKGVDAKGSGMEELIHQGADGFLIDYEFEMNEHTYRIVREKFKKGGQALQLFIDNIDHTGKLSETQVKINDIFKMDYDTFMDTVIIGQGESASFMKKSATERKKVIAQILRLDKYEILENYTKDIRKQLETKVKATELQMNNLYDSIKNKDLFKKELKENKELLIEIENSISIKDKQLENELIKKTKYEEQKKQQDNIVSRKNTINTNIANIKSEVIKFEGFKVDIETILLGKIETENKIVSINLNMTNLINDEKELNQLKTMIETENKMLLVSIKDFKDKFIQLKQYNECDCKFCGQQISSQYKEIHLKEIKQQGVNQQNNLAHNEFQVDTFNKKLSEIQISLSTFKTELFQLNQLKTKIDQAEIKIESVNSKLFDLKNRLEELIIEKNEIDIINIDIISEQKFIDQLIKNELSALRSNLAGKGSRISVLENDLKKIAQDEIKYLKGKKEYDIMREDVELYDDLQKAWGKNGIQAIIIDNILPQIEEEINKYLKILSNDSIDIRFETQKEAKNGNKSETLDIIVKDSKGSRPYERYSGGERTRIDFACHIGMAKFLTKRSGATIDFFVIDEGVGTLDESGKDNFIDTIKLLTLIFKQVVVISHIPDIKETFDNKILVTKDIYEGSKVTIIS